jgi:hypothetical protein
MSWMWLPTDCPPCHITCIAALKTLVQKQSSFCLQLFLVQAALLHMQKHEQASHLLAGCFGL